MEQNKAILREAIARLKRDALSQEPPKAVVDETLRRLADARCDEAGRPELRRIRIGRTTIWRILAAAALIALGCAIGRLSGPAPVNMDKLRETLASSVAISIEPAIRANVAEDLERRYQLALATTYVKVKEELTAQYREDLTRSAVQTLAASNATTNRLLAELLDSIDTAQSQDFTRVAKAIYQIEQNRIQDKSQLAAGLYKLASRTEELSRRQLVQPLVNTHPQDSDGQDDETTEIPQ